MFSFKLTILLFILYSSVILGQTIDSYAPPPRCQKTITDKYKKTRKVKIATIDRNCDGRGKIEHNGLVYNKSEIFDGQKKYFSTNRSVKDLDCNTQAEKQSFVDCRIKFGDLLEDYNKTIDKVVEKAPDWYGGYGRYRWETTLYNMSAPDLNRSQEFKAYCMDEFAICGTAYAMVGIREQKAHCDYLMKQKSPLVEIERCGEKLVSDANYVQQYLGKLAKAQKRKEEAGLDVLAYFDELSRDFGKYRDDIDGLLAGIEQMKVNEQLYDNTEKARDVFERCQKIVDKDGNDIKQRNIAFNVVQQMDAIACGTDLDREKSEDSIAQLVSDLQKVNTKSMALSLDEDLNSQVITKSALAIWRTYRRFYDDDVDPETHKSFYVDMVTKHMPHASKDPKYKKVIENTFENFKANHLENSKKYTSEYWNEGQKKLSEGIEEINKLCRMANEDFKAFKLREEDENCDSGNQCEAVSLEFKYPGAKGIDSYVTFDKVGRARSRQAQPFSYSKEDARKAREAAEKRYAASYSIHEHYYQKIMSRYNEMINSPLAYLLIGDEFGNKVGVLGRGRLKGSGALGSENLMVNGDWLSDRCRGKKDWMMQKPSQEDIRKAKDEFFKLASTDLASIEESFLGDVDAKVSQVKSYLKTHPETIEQLLKHNSDPDYHLALCSMIREINSRDKAKRTRDMIIGGLGAVAGVVLIASGFGAGVGTPLLVTSLVVTAGTAAIEVKNMSDNIAENIAEKEGLAAQYIQDKDEIDLQKTFDDIGLRDKEIAADKIWRGVAIAGLVLDGAEFTKLALRASKMKGVVRILETIGEGGEQGKEFTKKMLKGLKKINKLMTKGDITLPKGMDELGYNDTFILGYLADRLNPKEIKKLFKELGQLDNSVELRSFLSALQENPKKYLDLIQGHIRKKEILRLIASISDSRLPDGSSLRAGQEALSLVASSRNKHFLSVGDGTALQRVKEFSNTDLSVKQIDEYIDFAELSDGDVLSLMAKTTDNPREIEILNEVLDKHKWGKNVSSKDDFKKLLDDIPAEADLDIVKKLKGCVKSGKVSGEELRDIMNFFKASLKNSGLGGSCPIALKKLFSC